MTASLFLLVFAVASVALFAWWLLVLDQALQVPDRDWVAAGQSKILGVLVMVLLGTILYVLIARPALGRTSSTAV